MATVLVVDSDRRFIGHLRRELEAGGLRVASASGVSEALKLMREQPPDAVVTELMLDYVLAGWDLIRAMKRDPVLAQVPVIVATSVTGGPLSEAEGAGQPVGVSAWLTKPVPAAKVMEHLELLLPSAGAAVR